MKRRLLVVLLAACGAALGAGREFPRVVKAIENHYGVRRVHIPFLGVANFFVNIARPAGASGFQVAVIENLPPQSGYDDRVELDRLMEGLVSTGLHLMVRTHSQRDGESTYIYCGEAGRRTRMLIASFEHGEVAIVEVTVTIETMMRIIDEPDTARHRFFGTQ